jgi:hypothetical protein
VAVRTDGNLQIEVVDGKTPSGRMFWSRHYYVLPFEVHSSQTSLIFQAKRFLSHLQEEQPRTHDSVYRSRNPIFSGQILAEMLGAVCYPEFYRYSDQEVFSAPRNTLTFRLLSYLSCIVHSNCTMPRFRKIT